jgi:hypothetical protein
VREHVETARYVDEDGDGSEIDGLLEVEDQASDEGEEE